MSEEDLRQIRQIVREEIGECLAAAHQTLREEMREHLDAAVVSIRAGFSDLRAEMTRRMETIDVGSTPWRRS